MHLFDQMPRLEGDRLLLRELQVQDAPALDAFANDPRIYRFLPTFLYEQKYEDKRYAIEHLREECFDTGTCILLAVSLRDDPGTFMGLAEMYNLGDQGHKVSLGARLSEAYWGQGYATEAVQLMVDYLFDKVGLQIITAHVMVENIASGKALEKCGFVKQEPPMREDWERDELILANRYVLTKEHLQKLEDAAGHRAIMDDPARNDELVLVDALDRPIGGASKLSVHVDRLLHRAFSVVLVRQSESGMQLLLSKRSAYKYHSAGLWANSCCSHPRTGEDVIEAAHRRIREELGCEAADLRELDAFVYHAPFDNGITEHEFDHVLLGTFAGELSPDPHEVEQVRWIGLDELADELTNHPRRFAVWAPIVLTIAMAQLAR